ncbi:hypothetical protein C0995_000706, partial [Termitomyces sp. Mi166
MATVPDITLNYAQMEGVMLPGTDLKLSPIFADLESSPVTTIDPAPNTNPDIVVPPGEENPTAKRRRCTSLEPKVESLSTSLPTGRKGLGAAKKIFRSIVTSTMRSSQSPTRSHASASDKYALELSSENWLKLSPSSITEQTPSSVSHPSPPPSRLPSTTPELSNTHKRKRITIAPLVTPLQSPLPAKSLSVDCNLDAPSPSSVMLNEPDEE